MYKNKIYSYREADKIKDVIPNGFIATLTKPRGRTEKWQKHIRSVFFDFLRLLIKDCIENNHKFISPNREYFSIYIREKSVKERTRIFGRSTKVYVDVNIINSDGKIYEFILFSKSLHPKWLRRIRISHSIYKELVKNVNGGKRYFVK